MPMQQIGWGGYAPAVQPLEPALQIPLDAKPLAWLHNLAFSNAIANVSASDGSDSLVIGTGDGACNFNKGDYPGTNAWIGIWDVGRRPIERAQKSINYAAIMPIFLKGLKCRKNPKGSRGQI